MRVHAAHEWSAFRPALVWRWLLAGGALVAMVDAGCASSRPQNEPSAGGSGDTLGNGPAAVSGVSSGSADRPPNASPRPTPAGSGAIAPAAGGGGPAPSECRGIGTYGYGKGAPRLPCCDGLRDIYLRAAIYDSTDNRVCYQEIEGTYACIQGECGDGVCEEQEDVPCGCTEDCPGAVWEGTELTPANGLRGIPASCEKEDLLARLKIQDESVVDCGDLPLAATPEEKLKAATCARDVWVNKNQPFQLFWRTQGVDSVNHSGLYATRGRSGALFTFEVIVDANTFSINFPGATASWWPCELTPGTVCEGSLEQCLACTRSNTRPTCGCLPAGPRPGAPDGDKVEVVCEAR